MNLKGRNQMNERMKEREKKKRKKKRQSKTTTKNSRALMEGNRLITKESGWSVWQQHVMVLVKLIQLTENLNVTGVYHTVCSKLGPGAIFFLMFENFLAGENLRLHFLPQYWSKLRSEKNRGIHAPVSSRKLGKKKTKMEKNWQDSSLNLCFAFQKSTQKIN